MGFTKVTFAFVPEHETKFIVITSYDINFEKLRKAQISVCINQFLCEIFRQLNSLIFGTNRNHILSNEFCLVGKKSMI